MALNIAGRCRISVDEKMERDNTSIENQKAIIENYFKRDFPNVKLNFYCDSTGKATPLSRERNVSSLGEG